ncbi:DNA helicase [Burkholderia phage BCSR5]|nr:DNA helicase [Burkholderia phage BCSR5]
MSKMKIVSVKAELNVLRGLLTKDKKISGTVLSRIDESYFFSDTSKEIYHAVKTHMAEHGEAPTYKIVLADPDLGKEAKTLLKQSEKVVESVEDAKKVVKILNKYRQRREFHSMVEYGVRTLDQPKIDMDKVLDQMAGRVTQIRTKKATGNEFLHFGKNNNSKDMVQQILYGSKEHTLIPTGIKPFDDVAGGFARGAMVTIAAGSGAGKSVMASAMAVNMASMGYKVLLVPLEMSKEEMTCRIMANVCGIDVTKLLRQELTEQEKQFIDRKFTKWLKKVKKKGGRYTLFKPEEDMSIEDLYAATAAYEYDVSIVDYVSLLGGIDGGDDQWKKLGAVGRFAKIDAENRNRVNILLAQLSEDGKIRYSRALTEHSNNSWTWNVDAEAKETGIVRIEQPKSRNSRSFPFFVKMHYATMSVENIDQDQFGGGHLGPEDVDDGERKKKGKKKRDAEDDSSYSKKKEKKRGPEVRNLADV